MTMESRSRWLALLVLCLGDLMIVLDVTIVGVALAVDPGGSRLQRDVARVGGQRIPAHVRRLPAARRPARRPLRPPAALPARDRALHAGLGRLRACRLAGSPDRGEGRPGCRRSGGLGGRALADDDALHGAGGAGEGDGDLRLRRLRRRQHRRPARRDHHRRAHLELDLPRQRPCRSARARADAEAGAGCAHSLCFRTPRRRRCGHGDRLADAGRLRDRERKPGRLDLRAERSASSVQPRCCWGSSS